MGRFIILVAMLGGLYFMASNAIDNALELGHNDSTGHYSTQLAQLEGF